MGWLGYYSCRNRRRRRQRRVESARATSGTNCRRARGAKQDLSPGGTAAQGQSSSAEDGDCQLQGLPGSCKRAYTMGAGSPDM
eukprot:309313-Pyramimonas_sp.AAC.1